MKLYQQFAIAVGLLALSWAATAATPPLDFSRYQVILDRKPFGEVSPAELISGAAAEDFVKDFEMRAIVDDGTGLKICLLDKKSNKSFDLRIGETTNGIELVAANYDTEEATVRRGGETIKFTMKASKTAAAEAALASATGMTPMAPAGLAGLAGLSDGAAAGRKPFFSDLSTKKTTPFRPLGSNSPFQGQSLEAFMKARTNVTAGMNPFTAAGIKPVAPGQGGGLEQLMKANPQGLRPFTPGQQSINPFLPATTPQQAQPALQPQTTLQPQTPQQPQLPQQQAPTVFPAVEEVEEFVE